MHTAEMAKSEQLFFHYSLPASIKLTTDTNRFKKLLKVHLFHIAF